MILIGSRALNFWDKSYKIKPTTDWDIVNDFAAFDEPVNGCGSGAFVEWHSTASLNNSQIPVLYGSGEYLEGVEVCSPLGLLLIKRSHLHRDRKFERHITQYWNHLMPLCEGLTAGPQDVKFLSERIKLTKKEYPQKNPNLNQSNDDFFDDAVNKVYDHDWLHELYAYYDRPLYESLKNDDKFESAWCEKDLWNNLSHDDKNLCVAEECYVIATERFLVPRDWDFPSRFAYFKALEKVCTTLCSGWFRDWAIDHFLEIRDLFDAQKVEKVKEKINGKNTVVFYGT